MIYEGPSDSVGEVEKARSVLRSRCCLRVGFHQSWPNRVARISM